MRPGGRVGKAALHFWRRRRYDIDLGKETETPGLPKEWAHCASQKKQYEIRPIFFPGIKSQGANWHRRFRRNHRRGIATRTDDVARGETRLGQDNFRAAIPCVWRTVL
jgi:hypothetical protein